MLGFATRERAARSDARRSADTSTVQRRSASAATLGVAPDIRAGLAASGVFDRVLGPVQAKAATPTAGDVHAAAAEGVKGAGGTLPHLGVIQKSFGQHDVSGINAHVGGKAAEASAAIGAVAYATGNDVAFASSPDLHTAAHEAAHIVQQRAGVSLKGGVGQAGDRYEQHADAVADLVVQGKSAEPLLDQFAGAGGAGSLQRKEDEQCVEPSLSDQLDLERARTALLDKHFGSTGYFEQARDFLDRTAWWLLSNFQHYILSTGASPERLSWTSQVFQKVAGQAFKTGAKAGARTALMSMLGVASLPTMVTRAISLLISMAWSAFKKSLSGGKSHDQVLVEKRDELDDKRAAIQLERQAAVAIVNDAEAQVQVALHAATTANELTQLSELLDDQLASLPPRPSESDLTLANEMLGTWVLENATDRHDARDDVDEDAFAREKQRQHDRGDDEALQQLDLHVHQCRGEWSRVGVDATTALRELAADAQPLLDAVATRGRDRRALEKELAQAFTCRTVVFDRANDPKLFRAFVNDKLGGQAFGQGTLHAETEVLAPGAFLLECTVHFVRTTAGSFDYVLYTRQPEATLPPGMTDDSPLQRRGAWTETLRSI